MSQEETDRLDISTWADLDIGKEVELLRAALRDDRNALASIIDDGRALTQREASIVADWLRGNFTRPRGRPKMDRRPMVMVEHMARNFQAQQGERGVPLSLTKAIEEVAIRLGLDIERCIDWVSRARCRK